MFKKLAICSIFIICVLSHADNINNVESLQKVCDYGNTKSCIHLGDIYFVGMLNEKVDYSKAQKLYRKACIGGNADGCAKLGLVYEYGGFGVEENRATALFCYNHACNMDHEWSCKKYVELKHQK